jgi:hypothetical protein
MSSSLSGEVPSRAVDAAAALLADEPQQDTAAQPQADQPERLPERAPGRDERGRFAPRERETPTEAPPPQEQDTTDWRAVAQQREQELARLRGSYGHNLSQKDQAIAAARAEAEQLRQQQAQAQQQWLADLRKSVDDLPADHPDKLPAERDLLRLERDTFERERQAELTRRQEAETQWRQMAALQEDGAHRVALWGTMEGFALHHGRQLGLGEAEVAEVLDVLKTPELAANFRHLDRNELTRLIAGQVGPRLERILAARAQAVVEANRRRAVDSGAHRQDRGVAPEPGPPPWQRYTRGADRTRLGVGAATDAILAGILDE